MNNGGEPFLKKIKLRREAKLPGRIKAVRYGKKIKFFV
jgi:hypothetical protein